MDRSQALIRKRLAVGPEDLAAFCRRWHIAKLEVFGSLLREDFGAGSDIDFLVSFEPGRGPADTAWFDLKEELARLVGRKVDILDRRLVEQSRNLYRRHHILREAVVVLPTETTPYVPDFATQIEAAERVMHADRDVLRKLAG